MKTEAVKFPNGEVYEYRKMWDNDINAGRCELLKGQKAKDALHEYRRKRLLKDLKPGDRLTVVETRENRFRVFIVIRHERKPVIVERTEQIAKLCGFSLDKRGDINMSGGYGYSRSFQIGYSLGLALWPNGTRKPHGTRNGEPDYNGGYALKVN